MCLFFIKALLLFALSPLRWVTGVRGQAGKLLPGLSAPEIPVPPAAAAEHFPESPASDAAPTARPPAEHRKH